MNALLGLLCADTLLATVGRFAVQGNLTNAPRQRLQERTKADRIRKVQRNQGRTVPHTVVISLSDVTPG